MLPVLLEIVPRACMATLSLRHLQLFSNTCLVQVAGIARNHDLLSVLTTPIRKRTDLRISPGVRPNPGPPSSPPNNARKPHHCTYIFSDRYRPICRLRPRHGLLRPRRLRLRRRCLGTCGPSPTHSAEPLRHGPGQSCGASARQDRRRRGGFYRNEYACDAKHHPHACPSSPSHPCGSSSAPRRLRPPPAGASPSLRLRAPRAHEGLGCGLCDAPRGVGEGALQALGLDALHPLRLRPSLRHTSNPR